MQYDMQGCPILRDYDDFKDFNNALKEMSCVTGVEPLVIRINSISYTENYVSIQYLNSGVKETLSIDDFVYHFITCQQAIIQGGLARLQQYDFRKLYVIPTVSDY